MAIDDELAQGVAETMKCPWTDGVLEARQGGLGSQGVVGSEIDPGEQPMNGIFLEPCGVVGIGIAAGEAEDPLRHELTQRMPDLPGLTTINQAARQVIGEPESFIHRPKQDRASIRGSVGEIKGGRQGSGEKLWKDDSLCGSVRVHQGASGVGNVASTTAFYHFEALLSLSFTNNPG
jgi:hypothetical protein